jgi:hypothetical protein
MFYDFLLTKRCKGGEIEGYDLLIFGFRDAEDKVVDHSDVGAVELLDSLYSWCATRIL